MKQAMWLLSLIIGTAAAASASAPAVYFSDLASGPGTGGQNNKGAFVTIVGKNFGPAQGNSKVTIGGGAADNCVSWTDGKIVFQLGASAASGNIIVTTAEGASNGVPFTVRSGRIFFVSAASPNNPGSGTYTDPWRSPKSFMDNQAPGDICYVQAGTYTGVYGTKWNSRAKMNCDYYNAPGGTAESPIVWCGYPGHTVTFQANGSSPECGTFSLRAKHIRVCNLTLKGYGNSYYVCNIAGDGCAFINCRIGYQSTLCYGMIGIEGGSGIQIYGNEITGATSQNKLDHCIYFDGSPTNVDVAWNYFHHNKINVGPVFSYNGPVGTISIHNNRIDCRYSDTNLDTLGQWAGVSTTRTSFYNNIVVPTVSNNRAGTIYVNTGSLEAYNNTFVNAVTMGGVPIFDGSGATSVTSVNNIFYNQPGVPVYGSNITHSYNQYYNISGSVSETGGQTGDPGFVNPSNADYHLSAAASPACRTGTPAKMSASDYELTPRSNPPCRGAFEFSAAGGVQITYYRIGGTVKDSANNGVPGAIMTLSGGAARTTTTASDGSYQFSDLPAQGTYTVTPSKAGMTFVPGAFNAANLISAISNADFAGIVPPPPPYAIKGSVKDGTGSAVAGVNISLSGSSTTFTTTANDGSFQFANLTAQGSYTVTPSKAGMTFSPASFSAASLSATITNADFAAALPPPPASAAAPVIYFSDLASGPKSGGQGNKGAFVTLAGKNFGSTRGSGKVTIGGGEADNYVVWTDSRIAFQLGANAASGNITVTTAGGASNAVPFTVRNGNIYFVSAASPNNPGTGTYADPWRSPKSFMDIQAAGDICYIQEGTYTGLYGTKWNGRAKMCVDYYNGPAGTAAMPIVWCGYPGQTAVFQANGTSPQCGTFSLRAAHIRVCNLTLKGYGNSYYVCNIAADGGAFINCRIGYQPTRCYGMIGIQGGNGIQIFGNEVTGAASITNLDHCILFDGNPTNVDIAWNYFHHNRIDQGPVFSYNGSVGSVSIHNNLIDCRNSSANLDVLGQNAAASTTRTSFYNNIVIPAVSNNMAATISVNTGSLDAYNNTFVNAVTMNGKPIFDGSGAVSVTSVNNIFYNQPAVPAYGANVSRSYNLYYNVPGSVSETGGQTGDPLFVNPSSLDFHLSAATSLAYRTGTASKMSASDYELTPRSNPPCRGAFEYPGTGSVQAAVAAPEESLVPVIQRGVVKVVGLQRNRGVINPKQGEAASIYFNGGNVGSYDCRIFTLTGEIVWEQVQENVQEGVFVWAPGTVASGIYIACVQGPGLNVKKKIAVLQ